MNFRLFDGGLQANHFSQRLTCQNLWRRLSVRYLFLFGHSVCLPNVWLVKLPYLAISKLLITVAHGQ